VVSAFESETVGVFMRTTPSTEHIILYAIAIILVISIGLSAVIKLDRVVSGIGVIVPAGGEMYVSPFDPGIVRKILVKSGDIVKTDQVLATLDPTFTNADLKQLQAKLASDSAATARLEAELAGQPYVFDPDDASQRLQGAIWQKRQLEYQYNLSDFDGRIHGVESQVAQYDSNAMEFSKRLKLAEDAETLYKPLLEKGYVSKLQLMQATDERTEMRRLAADAQNQMSSLRQTLAALRAQREAYVQKWISDTGAELVTTRDELEVTRQSLQKAQKLSDLVSLNAPADAVVLKVGRISLGSVAGAGSILQEPLFTLVPLDGPLEADVNVPAADIGFIKVGQAVQVKLEAYRFMQHGTVAGSIKTISEGSFTTDNNNAATAPYFKVRVQLQKPHLRNVPADFRLIPGMTLTGDILVGKRTILSYLLEGGLRTGSEAMREP
jgi:HlyD family type I secretion membrane fusion protein